MKAFDYIIAGSGAAGLSLALEILRSDLKDRSVVIIDRDSKQQNDRTWCFWSDHPTGLESVYHRSWRQIGFESDRFSRVIMLENYRYHMIRGLDYYNYARDIIQQAPTVTFLQGSLDSIRDHGSGVQVSIDGQEFCADFAFDSIIRPADIQPDPTRYHYLKQHFLGWEIETAVPTFDPDTPVLFDFRTPQNRATPTKEVTPTNGAMCFMYILPFSAYRALVEYTLFSARLLATEEYEVALRDYLDHVLHIKDYRVVEVEQGMIPMTDHPLPRQPSPHILNIGTKGGRVKPSSGYAFWRIQRDSAAIVRSLRQFGHPFSIPRSSSRYSLFDTILLQIMYRHPEDCARLFTRLFQDNPIQRIFHFLDEEGDWLNDLGVLTSLPPYRFIEAFVRVKLAGRI